MKCLDRYLISEMLGPFFTALFSFIVLITGHILFGAVDVIAGKGVHFERILEFAALKAPEAAILALPVATLLGCSLGINRLASENELIPIFTGGIGPFRLALPAFILGIVAMSGSLLIKEYIIPIADQRAERLYTELLVRQKSLAFKPNLFVDTEGPWLFVAREVDTATDTLGDLRIIWRRAEGLPIVIQAETAQFHDRTLIAKQARVYEFTWPDHLNFGLSDNVLINLGRITPQGLGGEKTSNQTLKNLIHERRILPTGAQPLQQQQRQLDLEIHGRLALASSCVIFALLAIPIALRFGRTQSLAGVLATLVVAFVYFLCMLGLRILGENGALPVVISAWLQNFTLFIFAIVSMRRL